MKHHHTGVARLYLSLATGPGNPTGVWAMLRSFFSRRPHRWYSAYTTAHGEIRIPHWRWGPVVWGITFTPSVSP